MQTMAVTGLVRHDTFGGGSRYSKEKGKEAAGFVIHAQISFLGVAAVMVVSESQFEYARQDAENLGLVLKQNPRQNEHHWQQVAIFSR